MGGGGQQSGDVARNAVFRLLGAAFLSWLLSTTFFVGNVLALISVLVVRPIRRGWHDHFLDAMASVGWGTIVDYAEHIGRLAPVITGDLAALAHPDHPFHKGNKIVVANHSTAGDPLALFVLGHRLRRIGNMRFMVKGVLFLFPVLGLAAYFLDFIFLRRKWNQDQVSIRRMFHSMVESTTHKRHFWICLFPEGTRLTPDKLRESQAFAAAKQLPQLRHVLIPRVKGLQMTLELLRHNVDALIDVTIAYSVRKHPASSPSDRACAEDAGHLANLGEIRPGLGDLLLYRSAERDWPVHMHVRVIPIADIFADGDSEKGISEWIIKLYQEKDALLEHFNTHGCFPGPPNDLPPSSCGRMAMGFAAYSLVASVGAGMLAFGMMAAASFMDRI